MNIEIVDENSILDEGNKGFLLKAVGDQTWYFYIQHGGCIEPREYENNEDLKSHYDFLHFCNIDELIETLQFIKNEKLKRQIDC